MIRSMTGFAAAAHETQNLHIQLELKAVNHRFLDISCRMPEEFRYLENPIRAALAQAVLRGKVECRLQIRPNAHNAQWSFNRNLAEMLAQFDQEIRADYPEIAALQVGDILRFPGIQQTSEISETQITAAVEPLLAHALEELNASREREGVRLRNHLAQRLEKMQTLIENLEKHFPALLAGHRRKTETRLREAVADFDENRLAQEFALFIQKSDVDEEFSRLRTHIGEVRRILDAPNREGAGKRLDFLMQELNREANTLGSKAIAVVCTQTSVELKVLIEQMREQVQNIE